MTTTAEKTARRTPIYVHIAAWSIPVLVLTQFSMLAIVPVAIVMIATLADKRVRALRWWAGALITMATGTIASMENCVSTSTGIDQAAMCT